MKNVGCTGKENVRTFKRNVLFCKLLCVSYAILNICTDDPVRNEDVR